MFDGDAGASACFEIAGLVADGPGAGEVDVERTACGEEHAWRGLAPRVLAVVWGDRALGVVRGVVDGGK